MKHTNRFLRSGRKVLAALLVAAGVTASTQSASAALTLTAAGVAQGLTLTTFASGFPTFSLNGVTVGPVGIAFPTNGSILVTDYPGNVRSFATDTDNQSAASAPIGQNYGIGNADGLTQFNGSVYVTQQNLGRVLQLNNDGTFNQVIASVAHATGILGNSVTGKLFVTEGPQGISVVDPIAKTSVQFNSANANGLVFSADQSILYTAVNDSRILGFNVSTKAQVFDSGAIAAGAPDGVALGTGAFANTLFVNTQAGTVVEVDLNTLAQTVIATGGTRGDLDNFDPTNGTLLLTQTDNIARLTLPAAAGGGGSTVPLPPAVWSALATLACLAGFAAVRRSKLA